MDKMAFSLVGIVVTTLLTLFGWLVVERRRKSKIRRKIVTALSPEVAAYRDQIQKYEIVGNESKTWDRFIADMSTKYLSDDLRRKAGTFYKVVLPKYDVAYIAWRDRIYSVMGSWDLLYGQDAAGGPTERHPNWFAFLANYEFVLPQITIVEGDCLLIRNRTMRSYYFRDTKPLAEFLRDRWAETTNDSLLAEYRSCRYDALKEARELLDRFYHES